MSAANQTSYRATTIKLEVIRVSILKKIWSHNVIGPISDPSTNL